MGSSNGPRIKRLLKISSEPEWNNYKAVVLSSEVRSLDLVVSKQSGVGNDHNEACPTSLARIGNGLSFEEELVLIQPVYGGGDGCNTFAFLLCCTGNLY